MSAEGVYALSQLPRTVELGEDAVVAVPARSAHQRCRFRHCTEARQPNPNPNPGPAASAEESRPQRACAGEVRAANWKKQRTKKFH